MAGQEAVVEEEPVLAGQECLVGTWAFKPQDMQDYYDAVAPEGATISVSGEILLELDGESYEYNPSFTLEIDVGFVAEGVLEGPIGGTYTADDEVISTSQSYSEAHLDVYAMGTKMDATAEFEGFLEMFKLVQSEYECEENELTLQMEAGSSGPQPVGLTRQS